MENNPAETLAERARRLVEQAKQERLQASLGASMQPQYQQQQQGQYQVQYRPEDYPAEADRRILSNQAPWPVQSAWPAYTPAAFSGTRGGGLSPPQQGQQVQYATQHAQQAQQGQYVSQQGQYEAYAQQPQEGQYMAQQAQHGQYMAQQAPPVQYGQYVAHPQQPQRVRYELPYQQASPLRSQYYKHEPEPIQQKTWGHPVPPPKPMTGMAIVTGGVAPTGGSRGPLMGAPGTPVRVEEPLPSAMAPQAAAPSIAQEESAEAESTASSLLVVDTAKAAVGLVADTVAGTVAGAAHKAAEVVGLGEAGQKAEEAGNQPSEASRGSAGGQVLSPAAGRAQVQGQHRVQVEPVAAAPADAAAVSGSSLPQAMPRLSAGQQYGQELSTQQGAAAGEEQAPGSTVVGAAQSALGGVVASAAGAVDSAKSAVGTAADTVTGTPVAGAAHKAAEMVDVAEPQQQRVDREVSATAAPGAAVGLQGAPLLRAGEAQQPVTTSLEEQELPEQSEQATAGGEQEQAPSSTGVLGAVASVVHKAAEVVGLASAPAAAEEQPKPAGEPEELQPLSRATLEQEEEQQAPAAGYAGLQRQQPLAAPTAAAPVVSPASAVAAPAVVASPAGFTQPLAGGEAQPTTSLPNIMKATVEPDDEEGGEEEAAAGGVLGAAKGAVAGAVGSAVQAARSLFGGSAKPADESAAGTAGTAEEAVARAQPTMASEGAAQAASSAPGTAVAESGVAAGSVASTVGDTASNAAGSAAGAVGGAVQSAKNLASAAADTASDATATAVDTASSAAGAVAQGAANVANSAAETATAAAGAATESAADVANATADSVSGAVQSARNLAGSAAEIASDAASAATETASGVAAPIVGAAEGAAQTAQQAVGSTAGTAGESAVQPAAAGAGVAPPAAAVYPAHSAQVAVGPSGITTTSTAPATVATTTAQPAEQPVMVAHTVHVPATTTLTPMPGGPEALAATAQPSEEQTARQPSVAEQGSAGEVTEAAKETEGPAAEEVSQQAEQASQEYEGAKQRSAQGVRGALAALGNTAKGFFQSLKMPASSAPEAENEVPPVYQKAGWVRGQGTEEEEEEEETAPTGGEAAYIQGKQRATASEYSSGAKVESGGSKPSSEEAVQEWYEAGRRRAASETTKSPEAQATTKGQKEPAEVMQQAIKASAQKYDQAFLERGREKGASGAPAEAVKASIQDAARQYDHTFQVSSEHQPSAEDLLARKRGAVQQQGEEAQGGEDSTGASALASISENQRALREDIPRAADDIVQAMASRQAGTADTGGRAASAPPALGATELSGSAAGAAGAARPEAPGSLPEGKFFKGPAAVGEELGLVGDQPVGGTGKPAKAAEEPVEEEEATQFPLPGDQMGLGFGVEPTTGDDEGSFGLTQEAPAQPRQHSERAEGQHMESHAEELKVGGSESGAGEGRGSAVGAEAGLGLETSGGGLLRGEHEPGDDGPRGLSGERLTSSSIPDPDPAVPATRQDSAYVGGSAGGAGAAAAAATEVAGIVGGGREDPAVGGVGVMGAGDAEGRSGWDEPSDKLESQWPAAPADDPEEQHVPLIVPRPLGKSWIM